MRGVVEVPLISLDGINVGTAFVDRNGQFRIVMTRWVTPSEMKPILSFLSNLTDSMATTKSHAKS